MPACAPSHGARSRLKSSAREPGVCSAPSRRRYGSAWWESVWPAARALVFSAPAGRTTAPAYAAAEAGTASAGSAPRSDDAEPPQPASGGAMSAHARSALALRAGRRRGCCIVAIVSLANVGRGRRGDYQVGEDVLLGLNCGVKWVMVSAQRTGVEELLPLLRPGSITNAGAPRGPLSRHLRPYARCEES